MTQNFKFKNEIASSAALLHEMSAYLSSLSTNMRSNCYIVMKEKKKIWIPYKIWDETQWFINFEKMEKRLKENLCCR